MSQMIKELQKKGILVSYDDQTLELTRAHDHTIIGIAAGEFNEALATLISKLAHMKDEEIFEGLSRL